MSQNLEEINTIVKYFTGLELIEEIASVRIINYFKVHADITSGVVYSIDSLKFKLGIIPEYDRLFEAIINILHKNNFLHRAV